MMGYLDKLKKHVSAERPLSALSLLPKPAECPSEALSLLPKPPFDSNDSSHGAHFQKTHSPAPKVGTVTTAADFDQEWYEERAGIYEFDAGFTREVAERMAYAEIARLSTRTIH